MPMRIYHLVEAESLWALSQRGSVNLPQVKELQDRLRAAGFDPGPSDGWYGQRTADAVKAYQQANNLAVDGDAGPQTLGRLGMAGAQQTPAQPTPPAETPPAPAPRQPAREPEPTPAPAPPRREPQQSNLPQIDVGDARDSRSLRNAVNQIGNASSDKFYFRNFQDTRPAGIAFLTVILQDARESNNQTRAQANRVINVLQQSLRGSAEIRIGVMTDSGNALANGTLFLEPSSNRNQPDTSRSEPTSSDSETDRESDIGSAIFVLFNSEPAEVDRMLGRFTMGGATYAIAGVRSVSNNSDAIVYLGVRSGSSGVNYSIYAFSKSNENIGYNINGQSDFTDASEALNAFRNFRLSVSNSYRLTSGSSQARRRQQIMNFVQRSNPNRNESIESINRLSKLAGL
jgi:peptidoglycan hydrolase-like protein with peptidoglycan-binding domain